MDSLAHVSIGRRSIIKELHESFDQVLHKALSTRLDFSTTFHSQTDGQSERTIQNFKDMLWMCNGYW